MLVRDVRRLYLILIVSLFSSPTLAENNRGKSLYKLCSACHGDQGFGNEGLGAPPIAGMSAWYVTRQLENFSNGVRGAHPKDFPGMRMRPMARTLIRLDENGKFDNSDMKTVADYVAAMPKPKEKVLSPGNPVRGETAYTTCAACHGAKAEGMEELGAAPLTGLPDWYVKIQIHNFKVGIRGAHPNDTWGASMRPMAATLNDDSLADINAYISRLQ